MSTTTTTVKTHNHTSASAIGRVVAITGARGGIGAALVERWAGADEEGAPQ